MEVNAYTKFVEALLRVELMQFKDAINLFDVSKSAYEEVDKSVKKPEINELYSQRNREICVLIGSCQGDATALLGGVNSLNLNFTDAALDETLADEPTTKKNILMKKKTVEPKHSRPIKPFFFDLALNFVDNPEEFKK
jgi:ACT domain-containing protein